MPDRPEIKVQLVHLQGPFKGQIQDYTQDVITIGRHPSSTLSFPADLTRVSRKHAEIKREGNRYTVLDHSTNGTFVNGKSVKEAVLKNGDVLTFAEGGPKVSFLFEILSSTPSRSSQVKPGSSPDSTSAQEVQPPDEPVPTKGEGQGKPSVRQQRVKAPLIVQFGPTLRSYTELPVTIGSDRQCDFQMDHPSVIGQHAQIMYVDETYWIKDLTGQNRVEVNKKPISTQAALQAHDLVALSHEGPFFVFLGGGRLAEAEEQA